MSTWGQATTVTVDSEIETFFNDDLDTPKVILRLREIEKSDLNNKRELFLYADQVLALDLDRGVVVRELTDQMHKLLEERVKARHEKRWADSDSLRLELEELGLKISDTPEGQTWS
jgi:cysteinyl-tRNA synthetase